MKKNLLCFTLVFALMLLVSLPVSANDSLDSGVTPHVSYTEAYDVTSYNPFGDVPNMEYYSRAVLWAYKNNITKGTEGFYFHRIKPVPGDKPLHFYGAPWVSPCPG